MCRTYSTTASPLPIKLRTNAVYPLRFILSIIKIFCKNTKTSQYAANFPAFLTLLYTYVGEMGYVMTGNDKKCVFLVKKF